MFHLDEPIKAKLTEVRVLSQKDRKPDEEPGAKLTLQMQLSNDALSMLDGALKSTLFTRHAGGSDGAQKPLEDMEPVSDLPNLTPIGQQIGTIKWHHDFAGYELAMQYGTGRAGSNIGSENCQLSNLRITPKGRRHDRAEARHRGAECHRGDVRQAGAPEVARGRACAVRARPLDAARRGRRRRCAGRQRRPQAPARSGKVIAAEPMQ